MDGHFHIVIQRDNFYKGALMKRFFKKLFGRGDIMTRSDKAYYGKVFRTWLWSAFAFVVIAWVGTNLVLCALTTDVQNNFDIIFEAEQPTILPIGRDVNKALMTNSSKSYDETIQSVTFDKYNSDGGYVVDDVDIVATCPADSKVNLNDDVTLYRINSNKDVYILSSKKIQANPDSSFMFFCILECRSYTFNNFDTSLVNNMMGMFAGEDMISFFSNKLQTANNAQKLSTDEKIHETADEGYEAYLPLIGKLDLSNWNTENVTNMYGMFHCCISLNDLNLQGWNTSKVTDMGGMFTLRWLVSAMENLDLSSFDTSSVQNYAQMFDITNLKTVYISDRWNIPTSVFPSGCSVQKKEYTGK